MTRAELDEWKVSESGYPILGSARAKLSYLVRYAVLAPSGHNAQPWLFRLADNYLELHADRARALPVVDPDDRELTMSCGAALFALRTALRHVGQKGEVAILPDASQPDLLARVGLGDREPSSPDDERLFRQIPRRHTNRQRFDDRMVAPALLEELASAAKAEGAWLQVVPAEARDAVAELVSEGDRLQAADKRFRRELAAWSHPNRSRSHDGMRGDALASAASASYAGPLVTRTFDRGDGQAARDRQLVEGSPALAVVGTEEDSPRAWLSAGQALCRLLLRARADGIWASYLNQPIETAELRPRLAQAILKPGLPQLLLRLGYGPDVKPTLRRRLEEVLVP